MDFDLDGIPVGEVAVDPDYADVLGAGCSADGEEEGGGEKESDEEALEVYGFHACTIGLEAGLVKFYDQEGRGLPFINARNAVRLDAARRSPTGTRSVSGEGGR